MYFKIDGTENLDPKNLKAYMLRKAKQHLAYYIWSSDEHNLNKYCVQHYNKSLYHLCLELLNQLDFIDMFGHIIVKPKTTEADKLIQLITYGNEQLKGSPIFRCILEGSTYVL